VLAPSENPELIYELKPGMPPQPLWKPAITINAIGLRDAARATVKPAGVFRIICLGGDSTFGPDVTAENTYPALLEKLLDKNYRGSFEVWNAGVPNGTLAYQAAWAREAVTKYSPDLLLFRTGDRGPRAFIRGQQLARYFYANPKLYIENLRFLFVPADSRFYRVLHKSALLRLAEVFCNNLILVNRNNPLFNNDGFETDTLNLMYLGNFFRQERRVPSLLLLNARFPDSELRLISDFSGENLPKTIDCFTDQYLPANATDDYFIKRPPAHVHKWYAECLARELERLGYAAKK